MKLSEQIRPHSLYWDCYNDEPLQYDHNNKLVKIAENFAIDFGEWLDYTFKNNDLVFGSIETLFEIYKKEKDL